MPRFSRRRVLTLENQIFRLSGKPLLLIIRTDTPAPYSPGHLYEDDTEPDESTSTIQKYIFGKFEETDTQAFDEEGRKRCVKGLITVPMLYKSYLAKASYVDPYLDGSRFRKVGAIIGETRSYITQAIESYTLANPSEVV